MSDFGPFSVDPAQVSALGGANFGQFVNRLLATEVAAHGMAGTTLETTYLENVGDEGVDAGLRDATGTTWIPEGVSAWQFKAGDLPPAKCKTELKGSAKAIAILLAGGSYRLVLGATLTKPKLDKRRAKLIEAVTELGIVGAESRIKIIAADNLARWIEEYPALAVSPLLRGTGVIGQTFDEWSRSNRHTTTWVTSEGRDAQIDTIRSTVLGDDPLDLHLDGVSGLGKTRLVLEAFRDQPYAPIIVYSLAADSFPVTVLTQLQSQRRTAIVVIDECDRRQHETYAAALNVGSSIRLITIGEPGGINTRTPMISLDAFADDAMADLLRANRPNLSSEAERVVVQFAAGNIDFALKLAQTFIDRGPGAVGPLLTDDDIRAFFAEQLPDGQLFLASCALALFSRFGVDAEVALELDAIANGLSVPIDDLWGAIAELQRRGFLSKQGRFRSIGPHPVAVYLAARGWEQFGERIVTQLLPGLEPDLAERLFRRAADIGELDSSSPAMSAVLATDGPLASLDALAEGNNSALLLHFAVLAPDAVAERLATLISTATEAELESMRGLRRDLVWALGKLAWHSRTFAIAAEALLRLALAENESYSNNASGTWPDFFGTTLPATAASPSMRMAYLQVSAASEDSRVRLLAVRGADAALEITESVMVSGEIQGGVVVEPRGSATPDQALAYRNDAIDLLAALAEDTDETVSAEARKHLVGSIHPLLETESNRRHLGAVIGQLPSQVIAQARVQIQGLRQLFDRVELDDHRPEFLAELEGLLPPESASDRLAVLVETRSWDRRTDDLATELAEVARIANPDDPSGALLEPLIPRSEVPTAYAVGRALRQLGLDYAEGITRLGAFAGTPAGDVLIGFLQGLVGEGDLDAVDRYIDGAGLSPSVSLHYSVRGPRTTAAVARVDRLIAEVPVAEGARVLFGWMHEADQADSARYLREWGPRIETQADYNAAIDFAAMQVYQKNEFLPDLDPAIVELVLRRGEFPAVGQESHDWAVLTRRQLEANPLSVVRLLADLIEADAVSAFSGSEESRLLRAGVELGGEEAWVELMDRLERREWRLSFSARDWLGNGGDLGAAKRWIGESVERARILANVVKPGGAQLAPMARLLIDEFGNDERVLSHLAGQFISGSWTGNESVRITSQIEQVRGWINEPGQSAAVKAWGRKLIASFEARRVRVLQEEEEERD